MGEDGSVSVVIVRTNKLCSSCLYCPAVDALGTERLTAIEANDLCPDCFQSPTIVRAVDPKTELDLYVSVENISPWILRDTVKGIVDDILAENTSV